MGRLSRAPWRRRIRAKLAVLAILATVEAVAGAPGWTVLLVVLAAMAVPAAVTLHYGPRTARGLLVPHLILNRSDSSKEMRRHVRPERRGSAADPR